MKTPEIIIGTNKIRYLAGFMCLTTLALLLIRHRLGEVHILANVISYFTLCAFLFVYFFSGKVISAKQSANTIIIITWLAITNMGLSSGGMQLPLVVVYPVLPIMALVMLGTRMSLIVSGMTILTLVGFIVLEISGYNFNTLPLNNTKTSIMRGFWLIFTVGVITILGTYYISMIQKLTHTLQSMADTDYITGLPSRKILNDILQREYFKALRQNNGLSILLIKIDNFHLLYESAGQVMTNECLKLVAGVIQDNFKRAADYTGKFNDTEYLIILSDCVYQGTLDAAEKLRQSVQGLEICINNKTPSYITVSIACVTANNLKSIPLKTLLKKANVLIKQAIANNGNQVIGMEI